MKKIHHLNNLAILIFLVSCSISPTKTVGINRQTNFPDNPKKPTVIYTPTPFPKRSNIIFILTDDLDYSALQYMPSVRKLLVDQGVTFQNFLINVSLCCPSRASMLLGQYAHNTLIKANRPPEGGYESFLQLGLENKTIALSLQNSGYKTVLIGKYLNGYPILVEKKYVPPGWSEWYSPVAGTPYKGYHYIVNENGKLVSYGGKIDDYMTDIQSKQAINFIEAETNPDQPFFMFLSTFAPHGPSIPAKRHHTLFRDVIAPRTESFNEQDVSDKPEHIRSLPRLDQSERGRIDRLYRLRLRSLQAVDEMVNDIITVLEEKGLLENTYILFTSDNGFHLGQHRLPPGKQSPYEEDIRLPLIIRGPDVMVGQVRQEMVGNIDLALTFAEIAGATLLTQTDGRSLIQLLENPFIPADWRQAYLIEHLIPSPEEESNSSAFGHLAKSSGYSGILEPPDFESRGSSPANIFQIPTYTGLRTNTYLYVEYDTGEKELYNLQDDPDEVNNLVNSVDANLLTLFAEWLSRMRSCSALDCIIDENSPPEGLQP